MIEETFFTADEVAEAFQVPAGRVRKWIREGRLRGQLLDGFVEHHTDAAALAKFQEQNPRYRTATAALFKKKKVPYVWMENASPSVTVGSFFYAFWKNPRYALHTWKALRSGVRENQVKGRYLLLEKDWEAEYDLRETLERRYDMLKGYKARAAQGERGQLDWEKVEAEISELENILNDRS